MQPETTKIKGFPGYGITRAGEVCNLKRGTTLKANGKYPGVALMKRGKRHYHYLARLVATAYVENPKGLPDVGYHDGNRLNVNATNLYWQFEGESKHVLPVSTLKTQGKAVGSCYLKGRNRYEVYIQRQRIKRYLGSFATAEEARTAYNVASSLFLSDPGAFKSLASKNPRGNKTKV